MSESIEFLREKALTIATRIQQDPAFRAQLEQDPENTLVSAGFPARGVPELLAELQGKRDEVQAYMQGCICTQCCFTDCLTTS